MDAAPILAGSTQRGTLLDAETVLLVDDDQGEVGKTHGFLEQRVRAHDDEGRARGHGRGDLSARSRRRRARQQAHIGGVIAQGGEQRPQGCGVLLGQHLRGGDEGPLVAGGDNLQEAR